MMSHIFCPAGDYQSPHDGNEIVQCANVLDHIALEHDVQEPARSLIQAITAKMREAGGGYRTYSSTGFGLIGSMFDGLMHDLTTMTTRLDKGIEQVTFKLDEISTLIEKRVPER